MECDVARDFLSWEEAWQAAMEEDERLRPWVLETHHGEQHWQTLVDSGSSISMVQSSLLQAQLPVV